MKIFCHIIILMSLFPMYLFGEINHIDGERDVIISVFDKYIRYEARHSKVVNSDMADSLKLRSRIIIGDSIAMMLGQLGRTLKKTESILCKYRDDSLLISFFKLLLAAESSSIEEITLTAGKIFICQPYYTYTMYNKMSENNRAIIYDKIFNGFVIVAHSKEKGITGYKKKWKLLMRMKPSDFNIIDSLPR